MPADEPTFWTMEILPPGEPVARPDRRRGAATFRPYSPLDGRPRKAPAVVTDRRRRRRASAAFDLGRRIDLKS